VQDICSRDDNFCRRYRIHVDGDKGYQWIQLVSGLHVSGGNATTTSDTAAEIMSV